MKVKELIEVLSNSNIDSNTEIRIGHGIGDSINRVTVSRSGSFLFLDDGFSGFPRRHIYGPKGTGYDLEKEESEISYDCGRKSTSATECDR